jgi:ABC-type nitrate/sulfonate/bicarbonate transport system substrate-binding protein
MRLFDRRQMLQGGAVAGLGLLSHPVFALAEDSLPTVRIVNPGGTLTLIFSQFFQDGDYFPSVGIKEQILNVTDANKIIAALVSDNGDICGGAGFSGVFPAILNGAKLKLLGGVTMTPADCLYSRKPDIRSVKDLIGRTVGTGAPGALLHELTVALLQKHGVDYKAVNFVNIGSAPDVFKAVVAGTIDAGVANGDYIDQQDKYGVHVLDDGRMWDELPNFVNQAFYSTDDIIAKKRDLLVRTLAAHAKLFRFISSPNSKETFFKIRAKALGVDSTEDAQTQWEFFQAPGRLGVNLMISPDSVEYVQRLNVELGVQKDVLPFDKVADMSLAQEALKLL